MIIDVIDPSVLMLTSAPDAKKQFALCAYHAGISRGRVHDVYATIAVQRREDCAPDPVEEARVRSFADAEALILRCLRMRPSAHESILEHGTVSFLFTGSRIFSHEMVRHKIGLALTQMSTRYVEEQGIVTVIKPPHMPGGDIGRYEFTGAPGYYAPKPENVPFWVLSAAESFSCYALARGGGVKRESARYMLPHCLATHIGVTGNFRAWRHIIRERTALAAAPEIRGLLNQVKHYLKQISPVLVEGL